MIQAAFFAALLLAAPVISLPVTNPTTQDDTKVMKCIAEVISDTVAKPNPLAISQECLETLQGDERIRSILRHQNLLKEFQEIAVQGASERTEQQKKNSGFEDELSEVLESQSNRNPERDLSEGTHNEDPTTSLAELEAEKSFKNEQTVLKEETNSLEEGESRIQDIDFEDEKENMAGLEDNEAGEVEELPWSDAVDNHINDIREDEGLQRTHQVDKEIAGTQASQGENEHGSKDNNQGKMNEELEDNFREQAKEEKEEEEEKNKEEEEEEEEEEMASSEEEHPTNSDDMEDQKEDDNQDNNWKSSEGKDKYTMKGSQHHSLDEPRQEGGIFHARGTKSEETKEPSFQDVEDAKRWNKMDELAKQLTTTKRVDENESNEDPDRSMKMAFRSHNFDFHRSPEDEAWRMPKHYSKEEHSEGSFPLVPIPEEKKDEEGSANRRTEDQELESLAAIEAELEKVAHKLHALRRG